MIDLFFFLKINPSGQADGFYEILFAAQPLHHIFNNDPLLLLSKHLHNCSKYRDYSMEKKSGEFIFDFVQRIPKV